MLLFRNAIRRADMISFDETIQIKVHSKNWVVCFNLLSSVVQPYEARERVENALKLTLICAWTYLAFSFARRRLVRWSFVLTNHTG